MKKRGSDVVGEGGRVTARAVPTVSCGKRVKKTFEDAPKVTRVKESK